MDRRVKPGDDNVGEDGQAVDLEDAD